MFARSTRCAAGSSPARASTGKIVGAILFEKTMDGTVDGKPVPRR